MPANTIPEDDLKLGTLTIAISANERAKLEQWAARERRPLSVQIRMTALDAADGLLVMKEEGHGS